MKINAYHQATSLDNALITLKKHPANLIIGGGAWIKQSSKQVETLVDLQKLGLDTIQETDHTIEIGSMATLHAVETHPGIQTVLGGVISESIRHIMGVPFRNGVTIGGSIMGRYAFSDLLTPLLVNRVTLHFHERGHLTLEEFLQTKGTFDDILVKIVIDKIEGKAYFKKVSNTPLDFSILNIAVSYTEDGFKIALGSRPGIATRAESAMALLNKADAVDDSVLKEAIEAMINDVKFGSNQRAKDSYRIQLAKTYVKRGVKAVMNDES